MKIKILHKDILSLKKHLDGKKRIMTYGAGIFANDIKKILDGYGYKLDYAVVDSQYCDGNTFLDKNEGGGWTYTCCFDGKDHSMLQARGRCLHMGHCVT